MKNFLLLCKLLFAFSVFSTNTFADELRDFMLKQVQSKEFPSELYIEEYQAFIITDGNYEVVTKANLKDLMEIVKEQKLTPNIKSFRILSRSETEDFVSATFEYDWEISVGNTNMDGKMSGISVLLKTDSGYISIFDAQTQ